MSLRIPALTALATILALPASFLVASATEPSGLAPNPDCTLKVPDHPRSATGLATPYVLASAGAACSEADAGTAAFVQATILDPRTGALSVYAPVVRDDGKPLSGPAPPKPVLPAGAIVVIWTGFNGNTLKLTGPGRDEFANFQQQAYDHSPQFFAALRYAISTGKVTVPQLGTANDGRACPSTWDFSIVDQDQSDNNPQSYPAYGVRNASDEKTLDTVDAALGCHPWTVPSLDPAITGASTSPSGPLQEQQARSFQGKPRALIPGGDPFAMRNGKPSLYLQNLLRAQVDQPPAFRSGTKAYCLNLAGPSGEGRLKLDAPAFALVPPTLPLGTNLANQLANRFAMSWQNLGCKALTGMDSPIQVVTDENGTATSATYA